MESGLRSSISTDSETDGPSRARAHTHTHTHVRKCGHRQADGQTRRHRQISGKGRAALSAMHLPPQNQSRWSPLPCPRRAQLPTRPHTHSFLGGHRVNQRHRRTDRHLAPVGAEIRLDTSPDLEIPSGPPRKSRKPAVTVPARHNRAVALGL